METTVATIKAEFENEISFIPKTNRFNSISTWPYTSDYRAQVTLRVGNLVKEVILEVNEEWFPSSGKFGTDNYVDSHYEKSIGFPTHENYFKTLEEAGLEIDFSDIFKQYEKMIEEAKMHEKVLKRAIEWKKIREKKEKYDNAWIHGIESELKADKNKHIRKALEKTTFKPLDKRRFISYDTSLNIAVTYNGFTGYFFKENDSFSFYGHSVYELPEGVEVENKYTYKREIAEGKTRKAKRIGTLFLKFVNEVDSYISTREYKKNKQNKAEEERKAKKELLKKVSGFPIQLYKENKYRHSFNRRGPGESYIVYNYYIITDQPEYSFSDPTGFKINTEIKTEYKDGEHIEIPGSRTFSINTIFGLSEKQFKSIIDILMEGKIAIEKVITPK
jgi:hypothetical protein